MNPQSFSSFSSNLPTLFPGIEELSKLEYESRGNYSSCTDSYLSLSDSCLAVTCNEVLFLGKLWEEESNSLSFDVSGEIEFDNALTLVEWDITKNLAAVCSVDGTIHLVKLDGTILLSKKLTREEEKIIGISFEICENDSQILYAILSNGTLFVMRNLHVLELCSLSIPDANSTSSILKQVKFATFRLITESPLKAMTIIKTDGENHVSIFTVSIENESKVFNVNISDLSQNEVKPTNLWLNKSLTDYRFFEEGNCALFLTSQNNLEIVDYMKGEILCSCYIGSTADAIVSVYQNNKDENSNIYSFLVLVRIYRNGQFFNSLFSCFGQGSKWFIVPHGYEIMKTNNILAVNSSKAKNMDLVVELSESEIILSKFSIAWQEFCEEIFTSILETHSSLNGAMNSFGMFIGSLLSYFFFPKENDRCMNMIDYWDETISQVGLRRFPAEIVQLVALHFDIFHSSLQSHCHEQLFESIINTMDRTLRSAHMLDIGLTESIFILKLWRQYLRIIRANNSELLSDSTFLTKLTYILPGRCENFCLENLRRGILFPFLLFSANNIPIALNKSALEVLQLIPDVESIDPVDLISVVEYFLKKGSVSSNFSNLDAFLHSTDSIFELCQELFYRCKNNIEQSNNNVAEKGLRIISYALSLLDKIPILENDSNEVVRKIILLKNELSTMQKYLQLQILFKKLFHIEISYSEMINVGCEGLLFERLDNIAEHELQYFINDKFPAAVNIFHLKLDETLIKWIEESLENCLITSDETNESDSCSLTRLILVLSCLKSPNHQAASLLRIFQIPSLESMCSIPELGSVLESVQVPKTICGSSGMNNIGCRLCDIVDDVLDSVDSVLREQLTEAVRLFRIKLIAKMYNVVNFQMKNVEHMMAAVSLIINSRNNKGCVEDAMKIAVDRGLLRVDIKASLVRVIIDSIQSPLNDYEDLKIELAEVVDMDFKSLDYDFQFIFNFIPRELITVVIEDCVTHCLDKVEDLSSRIVSMNHNKDELRITKREIVLFTKGAIKLIEKYLDIVHKCSESDAISLENANQLKKSFHPAKHGEFKHLCTLELLQEFKRMLRLQYYYDIFISLSQLKKETANKILLENLSNNLVMQWLKQTSSSSAFNENPTQLIKDEVSRLFSECNKLKRICGLLHLNPQVYVVSIIKQMINSGKKKHVLEFVELNVDDGVFSQNDGSSSSFVTSTSDNWDLTVDGAITLSYAALKNDRTTKGYGYYAQSHSTMKNEAKFELKAYQLSQKLLSNSILDGDTHVLCKALDALTITDTVLSVYERIERQTSAEDKSPGEISSSNEFTKSSMEGVFSRDGLLMQEESILNVLTQHCIHEMKRRDIDHRIKSHSQVNIATKVQKSVSSRGKEESRLASSDIESCVNSLQKHENHLMALQVLYKSWSFNPSKIQLLKSSVLALCKKVLTYRDIDLSFAIACLSALPLDNIVKELKSSVPLIQNDFSRLQTVAQIGEEISHLFGVDSLLILFQGIQTNSKWWKILTSIGVVIDLKLFQSPEFQVREPYIHSIIPDMLVKNNFDLEMVLEYCRNFDVQPEIAALHFIHLLLVAPPTRTKSLDNTWINKIKTAAGGLDESTLIQCLNNSLSQIHPLDYEKIYFVCIWLLDILPSLGDHETNIIPVEDDNLTINSVIASQHQQTLQLLGSETKPDRKLYKLYIDAINYLLSLNIPNDALQSVRQVASLREIYTGIDGKFSFRLPFWTLIQDPWQVLDPIFDGASNSAFSEKLLPLCYSIGVNKEEYNARSIFAIYRSHSAHISLNGPTPEGNDDKAISSGSGSIDFIVSVMDEKLSNPLYKVQLWEWIIERELQRQNYTVALLSLQKCLDTILQHQSIADGEIASKLQNAHERLSAKLTKLKLERDVRNLCKLMNSPYILNKLLSLLDRPKEVIVLSLQIVTEYCWELQMRHFQTTTDNIDILTILPAYPTGMVMQFLHEASNIFYQICKHSCPNQSIEEEKQYYYDVVQQLLFGYLVDLRVHSRNKIPSNVDIDGMKASWSFADQPSPSIPTFAEFRRREDVFFSFGLFVLFTLADANQKSVIIEQLDSIMRCGAYKTVLRRLTGRSRFRAAQALSFIPPLILSNSSGKSIMTHDVPLFRDFLYCLAEMQEIRLTTSEESLLEALGLMMDGNQLSKLVNDSLSLAHCRSLIMTWIHDESDQLDVIELSKDLYNISKLQDLDVLIRLLQKMLERKYARTLFQALGVWSKLSTQLAQHIFHVPFNKEILIHLQELLFGVTDRVMQLTKQGNHPPANKEKNEWKPCIVDFTNESIEKSSNKAENESTTTSTTSLSKTNFQHMENVLLQPHELYCTEMGESLEESLTCLKTLSGIISSFIIAADKSILIELALEEKILSWYESMLDICNEVTVSNKFYQIALKALMSKDIIFCLWTEEIINWNKLLNHAIMKTINAKECSFVLLSALQHSIGEQKSLLILCDYFKVCTRVEKFVEIIVLTTIEINESSSMFSSSINDVVLDTPNSILKLLLKLLTELFQYDLKMVKGVVESLPSNKRNNALHWMKYACNPQS